MSKIHHLSYRCEKNFEASDAELERRQFSEIILIISFPNQVLNTQILQKYKIIVLDQGPSEGLGMQIIKTDMIMINLKPVIAVECTDASAINLKF